jgi:hypothetical protein
MKRKASGSDPLSQGVVAFLKRHALSLATAGLLLVWIVLFAAGDPHTHLGSFYGNAIADWSGMLVTILATKYLYEASSKPHRRPARNRLHRFLRDHHLTIFLVLTGLGWAILFARMNPEAKWGQVVGNLVSEWTQTLGLVLLTKRFISRA